MMLTARPTLSSEAWREPRRMSEQVVYRYLELRRAIEVSGVPRYWKGKQELDLAHPKSGSRERTEPMPP